MKPEESIFADALGLEPPERVAFLARACGADATLRRRVEDLLSGYDEGGAFLERLPVPEIDLARDYRDADLTPAEVAAMSYAERLSNDPTSMTDADSQTLRDHGYTDRQIVDITLAAAARNLFSRALLALAVPLEDAPGVSAELREALLSPLGR